MIKFTRLTFLLLSGLLYLTVPTETLGAQTSPSLTLSLFRCSDGEIHSNPESHPGRHRSNSRPLYGTITSEGVSIPGVDNSEILSFEIYTPEGFCMGAFTEEADFIQTLFSLSGEYEIRFVTDEAVFVGIVGI